ncbi:MAG: carboxypeptidase-like regulatory domain-containing protein [Bacteroidales bacterium]
MKKPIFALAVFFISALSTNLSFASDKGEDNGLAIYSLSGQVVDQNTGEALAGVLVSIEEAGDKLYTDFEGKFEVSGLLPGNYIVNTSMISYESSKVEMELNGGQRESVKIELNQATLK